MAALAAMVVAWAATAQLVTGVYNTSANCPSACGSTCRYGCTVCQDGTYIGWYGSTCSSLAPWQGAIIGINRTAVTYNSLLEWYTCSSAGTTLYSTAPPPAPPPPSQPPVSVPVCSTAPSTLTSTASALMLVGTYQSPAACTAACTASPSNCNVNGCIMCADGTVVGLFSNNCAPAPAIGSVVQVVGQAKVYSGLGEFSTCTSIGPPPAQCATVLMAAI